MVYHMINKCSKPAPKKYKSRHNLVGKVIHWELCKKLKIGYITKWYAQTKIRPGEWDV